jgi:hypothetical protein
MWRFPSAVPTAPPTAGPRYSTAVGVAFAGYFGPDPFHDLVGFVLGDLDEPVFQVGALGAAGPKPAPEARNSMICMNAMA